MIHISKRLFYAVEAVLYIAYNGGNALFTGKDIAERQNLPPRYLEQMMQKLVRAGVLRGVRGPRGGYLLAQEKRRITLADICNAIDEPLVFEDSTPLGDLVVQPVAEALKTKIREQLSAITLAQLCDRAAELRVPKSNEDHHDFII